MPCQAPGRRSEARELLNGSMGAAGCPVLASGKAEITPLAGAVPCPRDLWERDGDSRQRQPNGALAASIVKSRGRSAVPALQTPARVLTPDASASLTVTVSTVNKFISKIFAPGHRDSQVFEPIDDGDDTTRLPTCNDPFRILIIIHLCGNVPLQRVGILDHF